jgi:cell wall-associated NlpC family hydrolase
MPVGAAVAAGSLLLAGAVAADAAQASTSDDPSTGLVSATSTDTETVTATETRSDTATATKKLTKKVKAKATAKAKATRTRTRQVTVSVTRTADSTEAAAAAAKSAAELAAQQSAEDKAESAAATAAVHAAHKKAKVKAKKKANHLAHNKFDHLVLRKAASLRGKPYRWGGNGPNSFDCSGYVRFVMKKAGVNKLPRTSSAIASHTKHVSKRHRHIGDLIFFRSGGHVYHVGIYAGHGKIWHAPGSGRSVTKASIWTGSYSVGRVI